MSCVGKAVVLYGEENRPNVVVGVTRQPWLCLRNSPCVRQGERIRHSQQQFTRDSRPH